MMVEKSDVYSSYESTIKKAVKKNLEALKMTYLWLWQIIIITIYLW